MKNARVKSILLFCSAFVASGIMLTVIQPPINYSLLAWLAFVPFILACSSQIKTRTLVVISYLVGCCYWLGNLYWMGQVTWPGWLAFCLYTALLWPLLVSGFRFCITKKIPLFIAVPILLVGAERLQGLFLGGFYWRHLSHSQYANITLIQIADIFGAAGVSFLVAMVNGLIAELIIAAGKKNLFKTRCLLKTALVCAAIAAAVVYGRWRINQSDKFIEVGPMVGSVQSNIPQSVKESNQAEEEILAELLKNSTAGIQAGAELLVWPETMVQANMEPRVLKLLGPSHSYSLFDQAIKDHSRNSAFVLVGAYGGQPHIQPDRSIIFDPRYNSAFLYKPDGTKADKQYNKIYLVPFGEVVPFKKSIPWLHTLLMSFTPYDYDYSLDYGQEYTVFEMTGTAEPNRPTYKFSVMICYEDTVPLIARTFAIDEKGDKQLDWLLNISNDGWFVRFKDKKVVPSTELSQHTVSCVFRAVENRLAILRSVNTGISCLIDTLGRIKDGFSAGNLPNKAMKRTACAGWFADKMPIDKRRTLFSRYGQWLDFSCALCFVLVIIAPILNILSRPAVVKVKNKRRQQKNGK